jgi:ABC-type phosphate transport system auxiliary subunit
VYWRESSSNISRCDGLWIRRQSGDSSEILTTEQCDSLSAIPFHRELAEQRTIIEEIEEQVASFPDQYFTKEESERIKQRLNELESQLRENIEKHTRDQDEAKRQISELKRDFEILRQTLDALNKKGWAGTLLVRVARWVKNPQNLQLLKSGAEVAKAFLTDGTHQPPSS